MSASFTSTDAVCLFIIGSVFAVGYVWDCVHEWRKDRKNGAS